jgi:hypothetical protein
MKNGPILEVCDKPSRTLIEGTWVFFGLLVALGFLFWKSFLPEFVIHSNDAPYGVHASPVYSVPEGFQGIWQDYYWLGEDLGHAYASPTWGFRWLFGGLGYSKYYQPLSLLILGICSWAFFRALGLRGLLCGVAVIGAALNSNFFSNVCWGLGSRALCLAFIFLALAALMSKRVGNKWLNAVLAGLAVGMSVVEGADNGIIFSLYVAAFVVFQAVVEGKSFGEKATASFRLVLVSGFALFIAIQSLIGIFALAKKGSVSAETDTQTKEWNWAFATQSSVPPAETLRVIIPGLFGYRTVAADGRDETVYWGRVGENLNALPYQGGRFIGNGEYAGLLVVLLSLWAVTASFSKKTGYFSEHERKYIWFWFVVVVVSVMLAWGRFAPFYKLIYGLPFFSSLRNPMKFMHPAHMGLMILFGYGLLGLSRRYLGNSTTNLTVRKQFKSWWAKAQPFEKRWTFAFMGMLGVSVLGYMIYSASRPDLVKLLGEAGFPNAVGADGLASKIAKYSIHEVGAFVVWLVLSGGAVLLVMCGVFAGRKSAWAALLLGLLLAIDLVRANTPWMVYWNYPYKYATNPVLELLRQKPYETRVMFPSFLMDGGMANQYGGFTPYFPALYGSEWVQHHFPCYSIHTLDIAQDPRPPADKALYLKSLGHPDFVGKQIGAQDFWRAPPHQQQLSLRYWQITGTRYLLGLTGFIDLLNSRLDAGSNRFRVVTTFALDAKPGVQPRQPVDLNAVVVSNGPLALFEFTGALPRTKLFSNWQVSTNDEATLNKLADPNFNPLETILVSDSIDASSTITNSNSGTAEIVSYKTTRVEVRANADAPGVLLLNDRFDSDWKVSVDGQPAQMLRCNFIMRGVQIPPGEHKVVFTFQPSIKGLKISLVAIGLGVVLCGLLFFVRQEPALIVTASAIPPDGKTRRS